MSFADFWYSFGSGMMILFNPCGFAMLPAFISIFLQSNLTEDMTIWQRLVKAVILTIVTSLGFLLVFSILGVLAGSIAGVLSSVIGYISLVIAAIVIVLGVLIIIGKDDFLVISFDRFDPTKKIEVQQTSYMFFFLYGIGYALTSIGCGFPLFLGVLGGAISKNNFWEPLKNLLIFSSGMSVSLLGVSIAIALLGNAIIKLMRRYIGVIKKLTGVVVILAGLYLIYFEIVENALFSGH